MTKQEYLAAAEIADNQSATFWHKASDAMHEGTAQFEAVYADLARAYQELTDLLYAEAAKL